MAVRKVSARVELDGEREYKEALKEINTGNATLRTEMQKLQAEYKGSADSAEYLTKRSELLERQMLQQQDKIDKLREAVRNAAEQYGEADGRTQQWIQQLNRAEAEQFNLQNQLKETNNAMETQGEEIVGLGDTVEGLADKFGIRLPQGVQDALNSMNGFSASTAATMAAAAAAVAGVIAAFEKLKDVTLEVASSVDEYLAESAITGVPTEMLQAWDYAAPLIDTDAETIKGAMTKITKAMGEAKSGNENAQKSFQSLGVSITDADGNLQDAESVFSDVIDALGTFENQTERDAAAMALMGKSAQELNPLINAGSQALREYADEARDVGYILDEDQVKKLGEVDDAYQKLQLTIEANRKQMAADFAPAVKAAMELFTAGVDKAGEMLERSGIIENFAIIIEELLHILQTGGEILTGIPGFNTALDLLRASLQAVAQLCAVIADAADLVKSVITLDFTGVKNALGFGYGSGNANRLQRVNMRYAGTLEQYDEFYGRNAGGSDNWRGGPTLVGESGPEVAWLPKGTQIMNAQDSRGFGGVYIGQITIDAKNVREFNDIVAICQDARLLQRMR